MIRCSRCGDNGLVKCQVCDGAGRVLITLHEGFQTSKCTACSEAGLIGCPVCSKERMPSLRQDPVFIRRGNGLECHGRVKSKCDS